MNNLNICFECSSREKFYPPIPQNIRKIHQKTRKIAPWIHRQINHKWNLK